MTKKKTTRSILGKVFGYIAIIILSVFIITLVFFPMVHLTLFRAKSYIIASNSMDPVLKVNDFIIVKKHDSKKLVKGNIITFQVKLSDGKRTTVTHYLADIIIDEEGNKTYKTHAYGKEDQLDVWTLIDDDIIGVYIFTIPVLGLVINFFRSPLGLIILVVNIIIIFGIISLVKKNKQQTLR